MSELITMEAFTPHLNKVFKVREGRHAFELVKVEEHVVADSDRDLVKRTPFTLIFRGPPGDILPAGLWTFDVEGEEAAYELYLMPVQTHWADRQDYQAAFN